MRILFMGQREDELEAVAKWKSEHPQHEVVATDAVLDLDTVDQVAGFDALSVQQMSTPDAGIYPRLKEYGIVQMSSRTAGVDMYDFKIARENGISITNVPRYSPNAIAEFALSNALYLTRRYEQIRRRLDRQDFRFPGLIGRELATMRVAVIGVGSIGSIAAKHFRNLGAEVVGYDLVQRPEMLEVLTYVDTLAEAVSAADLVTIHVPLDDSTRHMFNDEVFAQFKPGALLVNAARGAIVDTKAMLRALDSDQLAGAALDVYENEFDYFEEDWSGKDLGDEVLKQLLEREDVLLTPHVAFYTDTAVENLVYGGFNNAIEVVETGTCASVMN